MRRNEIDRVWGLTQWNISIILNFLSFSAEPNSSFFVSKRYVSFLCKQGYPKQNGEIGEICIQCLFVPVSSLLFSHSFPLSDAQFMSSVPSYDCLIEQIQTPDFCLHSLFAIEFQQGSCDATSSIRRLTSVCLFACRSIGGVAGVGLEDKIL